MFMTRKSILVTEKKKLNQITRFANCNTHATLKTQKRETN